MGVLSIDTPDYQVAKGFLAQAKRAEPRSPMTKTDWDRMVSQCGEMLKVSPDSFILIYSKERGARFFSAQAVKSFAGRDIFALYDMSVRTFFERHIESFIGDMRLDRPHIEVLEALHNADKIHPSAHVLHLEASELEM